MKFTTGQIASLLNGTVEGSSDIMISSFAKIEEGVEGSITFLANKKYTNYIYNTDASAVIVDDNFTPEKEVKPILIWVKDAYQAVATLLEAYNKHLEKPSGIAKQSFVHKSVKKGKSIYIGAFAYIAKNVTIGDNVLIYPNTYIGNNVKIGDNTVLHPGVTIYHDCEIGKNCIIHAGTVVGSDGFGFAPNKDKEFVKIAQIGNVVIKDNVELGSLVTIDRATVGSTTIQKGVKLDNQTHIAHNVDVGKNTVIAAQTGIAGTTKIGENCMFGGQVGISPHVRIADKTKIAAQSGIAKSINQKDTVIMGSPAMQIKEYHKSYIHFKNFDKIVKRLEKLEKKSNVK